MPIALFSLRSAVPAAFSFLAALPAAAQEALYDAPPPPDAVFVRWLGGGHSGGSHSFQGAGLPDGTVKPGAYAAISAALLDGAQAGDFFTVLSPSGGSPVVVAEPPRPDRAKVHLLLISCEADPVVLEVPGRDLTVIAATPAFTAASRAVNPVATPLAVRNTVTGDVLGRFDVQLSRGRNLTFLACGGTAALVEHRFHGIVDAG